MLSDEDVIVADRECRTSRGALWLPLVRRRRHVWRTRRSAAQPRWVAFAAHNLGALPRNERGYAAEGILALSGVASFLSSFAQTSPTHRSVAGCRQGVVIDMPVHPQGDGRVVAEPLRGRDRARSTIEQHGRGGMADVM